MQDSISHRWAKHVTQYWWVILTAWLLAAIMIRFIAPAWNDVAYDGDFEYLPAKMSSVAGGQLLDQAFPDERSRSQIVLVLGREDSKLTKRDEIVGLDLLRRLYHRLGEVSWQRAIEYGYTGGPTKDNTKSAQWIKLAREAFDHSITVDESFYERIADEVPANAPQLQEPRMAIAYWDRGKLLEELEEPEEDVGRDFEAALIFVPDLPKLAVPIAERDLTGWTSLLDIFGWDDQLIGASLKQDNAQLAVLQLSSELAATGNIQTVEVVRELLEDVRGYSMQYTKPGLQLMMTGSAAIGGETLLAARDAIRYTEWITVAMILIILAIVYRAPLLVAVPMLSIGVAVVVSTSLVTLLAKWSTDGTIPALDLRIFTTSRIFVVVILFGAGTDYCLFLIARLREEAAKAPWDEACTNALSGVMGALTGSAMTTVVGLGMLWIASFGKFHYTGPIIAICLLVGLLVCTTLTPALLRAIGPIVFWPTPVKLDNTAPLTLYGNANLESRSSTENLWNWIALMLTRHPVTTQMLGIGLLLIPGAYGLWNENNVTYNFSGQLNHSAPSRQGLRLLARDFDIGQINPVTVLLVQPEDVPRKDLEKQIKTLAEKLYTVNGVSTVRTVDDPLGDFPPDRDMGLLNRDSWRRRALRSHRIAQQYFFSPLPAFENRMARLDVTIDGDPFAVDTALIVSDIDQFLHQQVADPESDWAESSIVLTGTTPSIIDLRTVTLRDNRRIKIAVVIAVFSVLLLVIRRLGLCLYLIATVLISYYATLGLTLMFFKLAYGNDFVGLDWKLPLFLFVILVAVGQDYNVYLVTRIVEEQKNFGRISALRRAISRTGGIITACGLVMAATFFSMTASSWFPSVASWFGFASDANSTSLRGITELGFALGLGVLIDTFYVRAILVPSFVATLSRFSRRESAAKKTAD
ncbi:MAG: MMPL family transporter [Rubripirellula sp.]|nr:MMPL family transporter [Rubripirellula sp.]